MSRTTGLRIRDTILWIDDTGESNLPAVLCLAFAVARPRDVRGPGRRCARTLSGDLPRLPWPGTECAEHRRDGDDGGLCRGYRGADRRAWAAIRACGGAVDGRRCRASRGRQAPGSGGVVDDARVIGAGGAPEQLAWAESWMEGFNKGWRLQGRESRNADGRDVRRGLRGTRASKRRGARSLASQDGSRHAVALAGDPRRAVPKSAVNLLPQIKAPTLGVLRHRGHAASAGMGRRGPWRGCRTRGWCGWRRSAKPDAGSAQTRWSGNPGFPCQPANRLSAHCRRCAAFVARRRVPARGLTTRGPGRRSWRRSGARWPDPPAFDTVSTQRVRCAGFQRVVGTTMPSAP